MVVVDVHTHMYPPVMESNLRNICPFALTLAGLYGLAEVERQSTLCQVIS